MPFAHHLISPGKRILRRAPSACRQSSRPLNSRARVPQSRRNQMVARCFVWQTLVVMFVRRWEAGPALRPGRYEYKFVINGRWPSRWRVITRQAVLTRSRVQASSSPSGRPADQLGSSQSTSSFPRKRSRRGSATDRTGSCQLGRSTPAVTSCDCFCELAPRLENNNRR